MNALKNCVRLHGNLGKDVELKTLKSGSKVARAPIATHEFYRNSDGEKVKETQWHQLVGWDGIAEAMAKTLMKGSEVAVQGKLVHRSYEDSGGTVRYVTEVVVSDFIPSDNAQTDHS